MTDREIVEALLAKDEQVTGQFFFGNCRSLFISIIRNVFSYDVDYDEFVNEFYLYLMENDGYRLRQFEGRSSIYQWLKVVAIRYFIAKRNKLIDMEGNNSPSDSDLQRMSADIEKTLSAKMDIERLFSLMPNKRYVHVIKRLVLQEAEPKVVAEEMQVTVDNLYNIKKRAIKSLVHVALKEIGKYDK